MDLNKSTIHYTGNDNKKVSETVSVIVVAKEKNVHQMRKKSQENVEKALKVWSGHAQER